MSYQVHRKYYEIKDTCRSALAPYLLKALSAIPAMKQPEMLDAGCGTGVPTLILAHAFDGPLKAIDLDRNALEYFKDKIRAQDLSGRIEVSNTSLFDLPGTGESYDIILAEGILNVVGFKRGFKTLKKLIKKDGYLIIHDENVHPAEKLRIFHAYSFELLESIPLHEDVWWDNYYAQLETQMNRIRDKQLLSLFEPDLDEIQMFKKDPTLFRSLYYILKHRM